MPTTTINAHEMYFEVHGNGSPAIYMGGWGTFCHGNVHHVPKALRERYQVVLFDHRGLGTSGDNPAATPSMRLYADDVAGLLQHLGLTNVHVVGLVGMGACIGQELAVNHAGLVRSLVNMNTWAKADALLEHQLKMLREVHRDMGWEAFQKLVCLWSFEENFYLDNHERLLGEHGPWRELLGRFAAHDRLIEACLSHDTTDRLGAIAAPTLVIHCPRDIVNGPRLTKPIAAAIPHVTEHVLEGAAHVVAGKPMRERFSQILMRFLSEVDASEGTPG